MYRVKKASQTTITQNTSYMGETLEQKVNRIVNNKEPISDGAPIIFTERKDGVKPEHDIRSDRFEIAVDAMDKVSKSHIAKREQRLEALKGGKKDDGKDGGEPTSIQGTETK